MNSGMRGFIVFGLFDSDLRRSISAVLSENRVVVKAAIIFSITKIFDVSARGIGGSPA